MTPSHRGLVRHEEVSRTAAADAASRPLLGFPPRSVTSLGSSLWNPWTHVAARPSGEWAQCPLMRCAALRSGAAQLASMGDSQVTSGV
jgi:hypothetical protein